MTITPPSGSGLKLQATLGVAGFALQNATPTILTWNVPNDGQVHRAMVFGNVRVTVAETGGGVQLNTLDPSGGVGNPSLDGGGHGTGFFGFTARLVLVQAGSAVSIVQNSALTAGAATAWAEIWGS